MYLLLPLFLFAQQSPNWETVNVNASGAVSNADAGSARMSANARFVVFESLGTNYGPTDTNGSYDVYLRDRTLGTVELISVSSAEVQGNDSSRWPNVSDDGRFVVFLSYADNLVTGDTNAREDQFIRDRLLGTTERVSVGTLGLQGNLGVAPEPAAVSNDGNLIAFSTYATNLSSMDGDMSSDVYLRDRSGDTTELMSINYLGTDNVIGLHPSMDDDGTLVAFNTNGPATILSVGPWMQCYVRDVASGTTEMVSYSEVSALEGSGNSEFPELSGDGRYVVFQSGAADLLTGDSNLAPDVFLRDRSAGSLEFVSLDQSGALTGLGASRPHLSDDGRYVVFYCSSTLVAGFSGAGHFLRDRSAATTELIEIPFAWSSVHPTLFSYGVRVNEDGKRVLLGTASYVPGAGGAYNVMLRKRVNGQDGIFLTGTIAASVGGSASWSAAAAPASASCWLLYSLMQTGSVVGGHGFNVGPGVGILTSGTTTASGTFSFTGGPIPGILSGRTLKLELAVAKGGAWHDSNLLWLAVL
jgi:Tol biopolymer transport system component